MNAMKGFGISAGLVVGLGLALGACDDGDDLMGGPDGPAVGGKQDNTDGGYCAEYLKQPPTKFKGISIEGREGWVAGATACAAGGNDDPEFLKAVSVVMRSIAVYGNGTGGTKSNCTVSNAVASATDATKGEFMWFKQNPIFGYHTGDSVKLDGQCFPVGVSRTKATSNRCKTGDDVEITGLGYDQYDRGAMSLDSAECMALNGAPYQDIIRNFYGEDIGIGCGAPKSTRNCGNGPGVNDGEDDPDNPACFIENTDPNSAKTIDGVEEGWFSDEDFLAEVPAGKTAWFTYIGEDEGKKGTPDPDAFVSANGASIEAGGSLRICQYVDCINGNNVPATVSCGQGAVQFLPAGSKAADATAVGCCTTATATAGPSSQLAKSIDFNSFSCSGTDDKSAAVYVSIENQTRLCIDDLEVTLDFGDSL